MNKELLEKLKSTINDATKQVILVSDQAQLTGVIIGCLGIRDTVLAIQKAEHTDTIKVDVLLNAINNWVTVTTDKLAHSNLDTMMKELKDFKAKSEQPINNNSDK